MTADVPDPFRDQLAEQAWGVLVEADLEGVTDPNLIAHAIVRNQLPLIAAHVEAERQAALLSAAEDLEHIADKTVHAKVALGYEWAAGRVREIAEGATT